MGDAIKVELMATGMGRHTGRVARKLLTSGIWRRVAFCGVFYDAVNIAEIRDVDKKAVSETWGSVGKEVAVIQLQYFRRL
jgi:hypothetical protein